MVGGEDPDRNRDNRPALCAELYAPEGGQPAPNRAERSGALGWVQVALSRRSRLYVIEKELFFKENEHRTHNTNLEQARCGTFLTNANW